MREVILPAHQPPALAMFPDYPSLKDAVVLVVDDEQNILGLLTAMLTRIGAKPVPFAAAEECLDYALTHREELKLIITDMTLPGMNGIDFASTLRHVGVAAPIIVTSGYSVAINAEVEQELRPILRLSKPFEITELLAKADKLVGPSS